MIIGIAGFELRRASRGVFGYSEMIGIPLIVFAGLLVQFWFWRDKVLQTAFNRRMFAALALALLAVFVDRVVSAMLERQVDEVFVTDFLLLSAVVGTTAITLARWLGWPALTYLAGAFACMVASDYAPWLFPAVNLIVVGEGIYFMGKTRSAHTPP
jgi:hypothetical protein